MEHLGEFAAKDLDAVAMEVERRTLVGSGSRDDRCVRSSLIHDGVQHLLFFDFATIVSALFAGVFLPAGAVTFAFLGSTGIGSFASAERSEAFRLRGPSIMSAGFSPGRVL